MKINELQQALREVEPAAVLVSPRVIERVIQQVYQLPGVQWTVPHRRCFVVDRGILFRHVEQDELSLEPEHLLPSTVILLSRPQPETLNQQDRAAVLQKYWRRLFHSCVHVALGRRVQEGRLSDEEVRARIEAIGPAEFEEIRAVLQQDHYLLPGADERSVYIEFAAVYLELRYFARHLLGSHFPGIRDFDKIDQLLERDLHPDALFERTRLAGAPDPVPPTDTGSEEAHDFYYRLMRASERASAAGNTVRTAILRTRAARVAPVALAGRTRVLAEGDVHRLVQRLQAALELTDDEVIEWARVLPPLLDKADQGNRPVEAALLHDLQNVCIDHEREIYTLDLVEWLSSGGRRPIKRPLPSQRLVRITKHLRAAAQKLAQARLSDADRRHLGGLLQGTLDATEERLRTRFRPILVTAFQDVGLRPVNAPEKTAFAKVHEEILDRISATGFFNFGDLRDTLSRNQLKLPDLDDPQDFIRGDPLLRLDRRLGALLDGVYRPSEFYARWLERISALGFGTFSGRVLTRFALIPFGGAAALVYGLGMVGDGIKSLGDTLSNPFAAADHEFHLRGIAQVCGGPFWVDLILVALVGLFLLGLAELPTFRLRCRQALVAGYRFFRAVLFRFPSWAVRVSGMKALGATWFFQLFYWYVLKPAVVCGVLWLWWRDIFSTLPGIVIAFFAASFLINSRFGQAAGEVVFQAFSSFYEVLRAGLLTGLYRFVVHVFKRIIDSLEYVLFSVDEWLRYRGGEGAGSMVVRTVLGLLWFPVSYVARFYTVVLVEPMINPIKLPVSCLAAKFVYPLLIVILQNNPGLGPESLLGKIIFWPTLYLLPDAFGFLFWEIKENWSLYEANRRKKVRAVPVGMHGESVLGLLHPGFHSGTVPKLFTRLRRAEQDAERTSNWRAARATRESLAEVERTVERFVERDLIAMLCHDPAWRNDGLGVGRVVLSINRIRVELAHPEHPDDPVWLEFEDRSAWLLACIHEPGWLGKLTRAQHRTLARSLINFYKLAGVDLVREQIRACLPGQVSHYDVTDEELLLWGARGTTPAARYDLLSYEGPIEPRVAEGADGSWPALGPQELIFARVPLTWREWVASWERGRDGEADGVLGGPLASVLAGPAPESAEDTDPQSIPFPGAGDTVLRPRVSPGVQRGLPANPGGEPSSGSG